MHSLCGQAEAMVINPDGSFAVTGVMKGGSLYACFSALRSVLPSEVRISVATLGFVGRA
mgnify:CR=1 FL=1